MTNLVVVRRASRDRRLVLTALVGFGCAFAALAPTVWHQLNVTHELRLVDLAVYRSAGQSLVMGRPVYRFLTDPPQLLPFTYPPVAAVFAVPLAFLPWTAAQWIWTVGQIVLLAVVTAIAFRPLLARAGANWPLALGLLVAGVGWLDPIRDNIRFGQVGIVLVALCVLDCVVRQPRWPRGLLIGLAIAVKLTPAVFVPYLWLTGRRRAAGVAVATWVVSSIVTAVLIPSDSWDYWSNAFFDSRRLGMNGVTSNQSLRGMLLRTPLPDAVRTIVLVICLAVVAYIGYRRARALSFAGDEVAGVAVVGLLAVLLSPVAWIHHIAWIVLALGVLADDLRTRKQILSVALAGLYFGLELPWYGADLLRAHYPLVFGVPLRDAYGLGAIVLVATLQARRSVTSGTQPGSAAPEESDASAHDATRAPRIRPVVC